jgi:glutamate dehydrogenase
VSKGYFSDEELARAIDGESSHFKEQLLWIEQHMPPAMFDEISREHILLLVHNLMGFHLQGYFSHIYLKGRAFVLCLDGPDADLRILRHYGLYGIKNYRTFISDAPPPIEGATSKLRIAAIDFTLLNEDPEAVSCKESMTQDEQDRLYNAVTDASDTVSREAFDDVLGGMNSRFAQSMREERLAIAFRMLFAAQHRDDCQYVVRRNEQWNETDRLVPSLQVIFAWRNAPKHNFFYRLAKMVYRHRLAMVRMSATYIHPYSDQSTLVMSIGLHGIEGEPAWETTDLDDFIQEFATLKYFDDFPQIEATFVDSGLMRGTLALAVRSLAHLCHQSLVHANPDIYRLDAIVEGLCRHPQVTVALGALFELRLDPKRASESEYAKQRKEITTIIETLDTGQEGSDRRRKAILHTALTIIEAILKTNFYVAQKSSIGFRLDPSYMDALPFKREEAFPELPYGIFFIYGHRFISFHIRFKDLSRGGLRTVIPKSREQMVVEQNTVFSECYNLAYTQQKKNKDIPEGGAKAVIFLESLDSLEHEMSIYKRELTWSGTTPEEAEKRIATFRSEQRLQYLYESQRSFIVTLTSLINSDEHGALKEGQILDYLQRPEYIYLGPDENMHNVMIEWIAEYGKKSGYRPGSAYISSKPGAGINHKEYGITSYGVNVYMIEMLSFLDIDPEHQPFTVKMTGGPDGDVAGNQILNLAQFFPETAKLLALVDVSGTIYDPEGLDLTELKRLFNEARPIAAYPVEALHEGAFLLNATVKKEESAYAMKTLLTKREGGQLIEEWLSGSDMNYLLRHNVHQTKADIFIPAGGRPRTLHSGNVTDYLDEEGIPTSRAIVEGANLYLTKEARHFLQEKGVCIIKDSSANKGGVMCSSLEVLAGLLLSDEEFLQNKEELMKEVLAFIKDRSEDEAKLLLQTHSEKGTFLTEISDQISEQINTYTNQLLDYFEEIDLPTDEKDPLNKSLIAYCPPLFTSRYKDRIFDRLPEAHKKAIIACFLASQSVYRKGLEWHPSIVDVIPLLADDPAIFD